MKKQLVLEGTPIKINGKKSQGMAISKRRKIKEMLTAKSSPALMIMNVASDPINYYILTLLPTTVKAVMMALNVTKMPANTRINQLKKFGLLSRRKGLGRIYPTDVGIYIKNIIHTIDRDIDGWGAEAITTEGKNTKTPIYQCTYSACKSVQAYNGKGDPHCIACGKQLTADMIIDYISAIPAPKYQED